MKIYWNLKFHWLKIIFIQHFIKILLKMIILIELKIYFIKNWIYQEQLKYFFLLLKYIMINKMNFEILYHLFLSQEHNKLFITIQTNSFLNNLFYYHFSFLKQVFHLFFQKKKRKNKKFVFSFYFLGFINNSFCFKITIIVEQNKNTSI